MRNKLASMDYGQSVYEDLMKSSSFLHFACCRHCRVNRHQPRKHDIRAIEQLTRCNRATSFRKEEQEIKTTAGQRGIAVSIHY